MTDTTTEPVEAKTEQPVSTGPVARTNVTPRHRAELDDAANRWTLSRIIGIGVLVIAFVAVVAGVAGGIALHDLYVARGRVIDTVDPAIQQALRIDAALVDQETGVRGYALSAQTDFLAPYTNGIATENDAVAKLRSLVNQQSEVRPDLVTVLQRTTDWRTNYAEPTIAKVRSSGRPDVTSNLVAGKTAFDQVRAAVANLQDHLQTARLGAVATLNTASTALLVIGIAIAVALVLIVLVLASGLRVAAIRPLTRLAGEARLVSDGNFEHEVGQSGPREVRELALDVDRMRERILHELSAVRAAHATLDVRTPGPAAVQRRTGAVRLRGLARPAGAAAQGGQLLPTAAAAVRRASWTNGPTSTSSSRWTARSGCRC